MSGISQLNIDLFVQILLNNIAMNIPSVILIMPRERGFFDIIGRRHRFGRGGFFGFGSPSPERRRAVS